MKQMSLIEMDGFLKGKCIPSDLKVNETNAEYLVRKFAELESKLETALREFRSAGIMPPVKVVIITLVIIVIARIMSGEIGWIW